MKKIVACLLLIFSLAFSKDSEKTLRVFAMSPPLSALLEIMYPQGMIALNYKPYPEDIEFMPKGIANLPIIGHSGGSEPVFEKLISLKPDVIFFDKSTDKKILDSYAKFGIKIVLVDSHDISKIKDTINAYGKALNIESRAEKLIDFVNKIDKKMQDLYTKISHRPKIYFAQGLDGLKSQCGKSDDRLDLAYKIGGINALDCSMDYTSIDFEILNNINPEIIFVREIGLYKELISNPPKQWKNISAIKDKRIYYAPSTPSNWLMKPPSIMQVLGIPYAFSKVHSKLLSEDEVVKISKEFFATFLRELNDRAYNRISAKDK